MEDNVYAVNEIVGTSQSGLDDAIRNAVHRASRTVRGIDWFEVTEVRGHVEDGQVVHFQVALKLGFRVEN